MLKSISFPNIFKNGIRTNIIEDQEATRSNLKLVILSSKGEFFGDPYWGTNLKRMFYDTGSNVLYDLVVDEIYTAIVTFMPQISLKRKDIKVYSDKVDVYVKINCINKLDNTNNLYIINMTGE